MKKIWIILSIALLSCACTKAGLEVVGEQDYGYLTLNLSSDNDVNMTKAVTTVNDLSNWTVTVSQEGGSFVPVSCKASELSGKAFVAGTYTVSVNNYADDAAACAANSNWGAARYEGSTSVTVEKGKSNPVTVACGTAKNARFKVVFADSFKAICTDGAGDSKDDYSLSTGSTGETRILVFNKENTSALAYYAAGATVGYTLHYTYNGVSKNPTGSFTMGAAATEKTITISANNNGTISLTISYDDTFTDGGSETVEIDAATGDVVVSN